MAKRLTLKERDTLSSLLDTLKKSRDAGQKTRIRGIISTKKGKTRKEIAEELSVSYDSVGDWVKKYNEGGMDALKTNKGGRPEGNPKGDTSIFDDLVKEIEKEKRYWSVPIMQRWIKKRHKADIPGNTVWYHVTDLKYSYKSARPHPYKGDKEKQESFKKGALLKTSRP
jgi:transposase